MNNLDLNIDNYKLNELERLFNLNKRYSFQDIENKSEILKNNIEKISITNHKKLEIKFFIDTICSKLKTQSFMNETNIIVNGSHIIQENMNSIIGKDSQISKGRVAGGVEKYDPGYLNPINIRTISRVLNIDSRFRDNYYNTNSSDYIINLPDIQKNVVSIRISSIELPMTYHAIKKLNNNASFVIHSDTLLVGTTSNYLSMIHLDENQQNRIISLTQKHSAWLIILEDGNYELDWQKKSKSSSIVTCLNNAIANSIPGVIDEFGNFGAYISPLDISNNQLNPYKDIAFNVDRISGRSIFSIPSSSVDVSGMNTSIFNNISFTINFAVDYGGNMNLNDNIQLLLGWKLGYRAASYKNASSIISEGICIISGPNYAYLSIDDGQKNYGTNFIASYSNSTIDKCIISRLNLSSIFDNVGAYKSGSDAGLSTQLNREREYFGPVNITRLHLKLLDEYGRVLDLNNMDWSLSVIFNILYD